VPEIIEKRKPLTAHARRAGWIGSNILLNKIPQIGKIFLIKQKRIEPKEKVLAEWKKTLFLREEKEISVRGWLLDIMRCIEKIGKSEFTLDDVYTFKGELRVLHPENRHIKDKIRQQLQILRDKGYLDFVSRGYYRLHN
jgi:type II restriction enzyme